MSRLMPLIKSCARNFAGTARQAAMPLNRGHGDLSLTGEGRQPMVSTYGDLEVEHSGLEVSESK